MRPQFRSPQARSMWMAMLCAAAVTAQFVGGKATRDALFLSALSVTALPTMLIATSICSILVVAAWARGSRRYPPSILVPASFIVSGLLFLAEWLFRASAPVPTAVAVYLHVSGAGPLLASGFWLIVSERFDPRTAKRRFGQIAGAGTLGGLFGALLAERVAALFGAPSMLLCLAGFQLVAAGLALTTSTPSIALVAGGIAALVAPGLGSVLVARGGESIFRASWFRAGYELFFTPIPVADKRAAKSIIDVAVDRLGDAAGGGLVRVAIVFLPAMQSSAIISMAIVASLGAVLAASHLNRWYVRTLEASLLRQSVDLDLGETHGGSTTKVVEVVRLRRLGNAPPR